MQTRTRKKHYPSEQKSIDPPGSSSATVVRQYLQEQHCHWTLPRSLVFSALLKGPASLPELAERLRKDIDRSSVYRTIELFEELGIAHRIWSGQKSVLELTDRFSAHHHHFVCERCGKLIDFDDTRLESAIASSARSLGLSATHHHLELFGLCTGCRAKR
jgi:Fur family ferric uptake transcriptional regulator